MADESTEIFDDLYLGLRAGGAMRKQRRGEPLTTEEQEALGRWAGRAGRGGGGAAGDRGAGGAGPRAAALGLAEGGRDRRLHARDVRPGVHPRRPDLRP